MTVKCWKIAGKGKGNFGVFVTHGLDPYGAVVEWRLFALWIRKQNQSLEAKVFSGFLQVV